MSFNGIPEISTENPEKAVLDTNPFTEIVSADPKSSLCFKRVIALSLCITKENICKPDALNLPEILLTECQVNGPYVHKKEFDSKANDVSVNSAFDANTPENNSPMSAEILL